MDESRVCENGYVPYGWQFPDEKVGILAQRGQYINIFGVISRDNRLFFETTQGKGTSEFVINTLDKFAQTLSKKTVLVLDNCAIHTSKEFMAKIDQWQEQNLFIFYLPLILLISIFVKGCGKNSKHDGSAFRIMLIFKRLN